MCEISSSEPNRDIEYFRMAQNSRLLYFAICDGRACRRSTILGPQVIQNITMTYVGQPPATQQRSNSTTLQRKSTTQKHSSTKNTKVQSEHYQKFTPTVRRLEPGWGGSGEHVALTYLYIMNKWNSTPPDIIQRPHCNIFEKRRRTTRLTPSNANIFTNRTTSGAEKTTKAFEDTFTQ